ncbi:LamG domain-containing protein [Fulvivirga sp. M361]|uniref:LamG domain-containing protein n=1 Tax=Fulvivirga sp. M361 TaxID=2594266 RepID=UPI0016299182|nr:PKD domain-containing protein [Fulvivirga sp. M361]
MKQLINVLTSIFLIPIVFFSCGDDEGSPMPVKAKFSVNDSSIVVGQEVIFTDASTGEPTSWEWSFEGGNPSGSSDRNPRVTYNQPGEYSVELTVSNGRNSDTIEKEELIVVISEIKADFFVNDSSIVVGQEVTFTDTSTGEPTNWEWSFEGGSPSSFSGRNPKVTYDQPGEYSVKLTASNGSSADMTEKEEFVKVFLPVDASFTADQMTINEGGKVNFTDTSEGTLQSRRWTFEGGTPGTSVDSNPEVTYSTAGTYRVTLNVSNEASSDTEEKEAFITVVGTVKAQFEADKLSTNVGEEISFTDLSLGTPNNWQWSFEGGTPATSTVSSPSVVYSTPGLYKVSLTVSNATSSETETKDKYILVSDLPDVGLIAYYPFDGNGTDNGAMGFDGTLFGGITPATDRNDRPGMALSFDDSNGHVRTTNELDNTMGNGVTFAAWIYLSTETGASMGIISNFNGQGSFLDQCTPGNRIGFNLIIQSDRSLRMTYGTNSNKYRGRTTSANTFELNTWYHIAGTWDGRTENNNAFKLYVNGVIRDNATFESGLARDICDEFVESESPFYFGTASCASGLCAPFNGAMDDLVIYNRTLTTSEIQSLAEQD